MQTEERNVTFTKGNIDWIIFINLIPKKASDFIETHLFWDREI